MNVSLEIEMNYVIVLTKILDIPVVLSGVLLGAACGHKKSLLLFVFGRGWPSLIR